MNPNLLSAHFYYGIFCGFIKDFDSGEKYLRYAIESDSMSGIVRTVLSFDLWKAEKFEESLDIANNIIEKHPHFWGGYTSKLLNLIEAKQYEGAVPIAEKLCKMYPNSVSKYVLGLVYLFTG